MMLAGRFDLFDGAADDRRIDVDAIEMRVGGLEPGHGVAGEDAMHRSRGAEYRVAFGHGSFRPFSLQPSASAFELSSRLSSSSSWLPARRRMNRSCSPIAVDANPASSRNGPA